MLFSNSTIDAKLNQSYVLTGEERRSLINEIQHDIAVQNVPCFYIQQQGQDLIWNDKYVSNYYEFSNPLGIWDFSRVIYTPQTIAFIETWNITWLI